MEYSEYKPYVLVSFEKQNDKNYILGILPNDDDEDCYYEIHIETESTYINNIKHYTGDYIFIDIISSNKLEIYFGEYYEECGSDGEFEYISYSTKKIEKTNKTIWKPKFYSLKSEFQELFNVKLKPYEIIRRKVVDNYRNIYSEEIKKVGENEMKMLTKGGLFQNIYQLFEFNPTWDSFNKLIDPNFQYYPPTKKDWEVEYIELNKIYDNLKIIDVESYSVIKTHIIKLYKKTFNHMLPNLKYNYKDIDESVYEFFFNLILEKLNQTEN